VSAIPFITDQPARRPVRDPQHTTQFGGREIRDGGGAVPTQPDRMLTAGQPVLRYGVSSMEVGPMSCDLESSGFCCDQGVFVGLRGGQSAGRIQLHQIIIIEHTFNIRLAADTFAANRHQATADNTSPIRTTPAGFRTCGDASAICPVKCGSSCRARRATLVTPHNSPHHVPMPDLPAESDIEPAEAARGLRLAVVPGFSRFRALRLRRVPVPSVVRWRDCLE
jgi:hypothetical protein